MAKYLSGIVISDKADKTIVITSRTRKTHPIYKKQYTENTKFIAHDEKNEAKVGDRVVIVEVRPMSARKRFKLDKIIERGGTRFEETDAVADVAEEVVEPVHEVPAEKEKPAVKSNEAGKTKENDK